ncbi:hypothetical protein [Nocardia rhamnosiphila]
MTWGSGIYFQICGPDVYVGFAAQQRSAGNDVDGMNTTGWEQVQSIYRDLTNGCANSVTHEGTDHFDNGFPHANFCP